MNLIEISQKIWLRLCICEKEKKKKNTGECRKKFIDLQSLGFCYLFSFSSWINLLTIAEFERF